MKDDFNYFLPFGKVQKTDDGARVVSGYASTTRLDLDGEIVSTDAIKAALPGYMDWRNIRQMHQPIAVGTAKEAHVDGDGLYLTARIVDPACIKLIDEEVLRGFSIGGKKLAKTGNTITSIDLIEISVVDRPANPDCSFSVQKSAKGVTMGKSVSVDITPSADAEDERSWLRKMVESFAGKPLNLAPAQLGKSLAFDLPSDDDPLGDLEFAKLCKREFSDKERTEAAASGEAMPGGGFPIKSEQDVKNAVQAFGRAKDKDAAKKHIIKRAKALKATQHLPAEWEGSTQKTATIDPRIAALVDDPLFGGTGMKKLLNDPLFGGSGDPDDALFGFDTPPELSAFLKTQEATEIVKKVDVRERLVKGCAVVADLAYAFSSIREAQRRLIAEGFIEKDGDDQTMATKLGSIASELATVMAQKATHEASEAIFLTDADDITSYYINNGVLEMNDKPNDLLKRHGGKANLGTASRHLMQAGAAHAKCMGCMAKLGAMTGGAARKAAAGAGDGFDTGAAMSLIREMHGHGQEAADHMEMAHAALGKAGESNADASAAGFANGSVTEGDWGGSKVDGVDESTRTEGDVPWYSATAPYAGKAAIIGNAAPQGYVTLEQAKMMSENAALKAQLAGFSKTPAGVFKGRTFVSAEVGDQTGLTENGGGDRMSLLMKGIDVVDQNDPTSVKDAAGRMIGNMLANAKTFGKSVFDPDFKGGAGMKATGK